MLVSKYSEINLKLPDKTSRKGRITEPDDIFVFVVEVTDVNFIS